VHPEGIGWVARLAGPPLLLLLVACRSGGPAPRPDAGSGPRLAPPPPIALALPAGWAVAVGADGVVRASGPRGQPLLRAEVERAVGLPTADTLRTGFVGGLRHLRPRSETVTERPGFIAVRFVLAEPDGGAPDAEALLSATALGDDTLLCATLPGATREELDAVLAACQAAGSAGAH
jgi:hypothetical protein